MTQPADFPEWDINETNTTQPDSTRRNDGWVVTGGTPEKPPFQFDNYQQNLVYKWIVYLNDIGNLSGYKNLLINPNGLVNQRAYVSATATVGANEYTLDRWRVVTSGQNLTFSTTANKTTFTAPAGGVEQEIEGLNIQSGTHTITFEGTATCTVDAVAKVSGDTFTLTGGVNSVIKFSSGTFSLPQVEIGSNGTSFENRPVNLELSLCKRYFRRNQYNLRFQSTGAGSSFQMHSTYILEIPMRVTPTISNFQATVQTNISTLGTFAITNESVFVQMRPTAAGITAGEFTEDLSAEL